jgi:hypothetical protein
MQRLKNLLALVQPREERRAKGLGSLPDPQLLAILPSRR